jgi:Ankyrin repeat
MVFQKGFTVLMMAAQEGQEDIVKLLLKCGANKEAQDNVRILFFLSFVCFTFTSFHSLLPPVSFLPSYLSFYL